MAGDAGGTLTTDMTRSGTSESGSHSPLHSCRPPSRQARPPPCPAHAAPATRIKPGLGATSRRQRPWAWCGAGLATCALAAEGGRGACEGGPRGGGAGLGMRLSRAACYAEGARASAVRQRPRRCGRPHGWAPPGRLGGDLVPAAATRHAPAPAPRPGAGDWG